MCVHPMRRVFPLLIVFAFTLVCGVALASPAPVYRCMVDGIPAYVSHPIKNGRCRTVPHAPPPPTPVATVYAEEEIEKTFNPSRPSERPPQVDPSRPLPPLPPVSPPSER